jgi:hypothetical protein
MISTVTVVYEPEIQLLKTHAQSFDLYMSRDAVETILVVDNGEEKLDIDPAWWGKLSDKVVVVNREQIGYKSKPTINGRETQQICKILGSVYTDSEWSLWFDAKTFLVRPFELSEFFVDGKFTSTSWPVFSQFSDGFKNVKQLLDLELPEERWLAPGGVPHPVNLTILQSMLNYITITTKRSFVDWFEEYSQYPHFATELLLYGMFCFYTNLFHVYYTDTQPIFQTINLADWQLDTEDEKAFWLNINKTSTLTASIKDDAYNLLSIEKRQQWDKFLNRKGLQYDHKGR